MTMNVKSAGVCNSVYGKVVLFKQRQTFATLGMAVAYSLIALCCNAQNPIDTGILPYHVYQSGNIDNINLDNQALTVSIPLVSYPQRGSQLAMSFALVFSGPQNFGNTACQIISQPGARQRVTSCQTSYAMPSLVGGPTLLPVASNAARGVKLVDTQEVDENLTSLGIIEATGTYHTSQVVWLTADGGAHPAGQLTNGTGQIALDGSGYQNGMTYSISDTSMYGTATCQWLCSEAGLIAVKDGVSYFTVGQGPSTQDGNILRMDADGNYITRSSTQFVDTVGRVIPLPTLVSNPTSAQIASCGGPLPVAEIATWMPPGYTQPFLFCFATITIHLPLSSTFTPGTSSYSETTLTNPELQNVVLPNGQVWTFQYGESLDTYTLYENGTGGQVAQSGINTGDLTQITFPTGGTLSYAYQLSNSLVYPSAGTNEVPEVASRTLNPNDGTGPHTWTYSLIPDPGAGAQTSTVTDPVGNITTLSLTPSVAASQTNAVRTTSIADSTGKVWQTVTQIYPWQYSTFKGFPLYLSSSKTTLDTGQSTLTTYTYCCDIPVAYEFGSATPAGSEYFYDVSNGKVIDEQVYDFTTGTEGTLLRDTKTSWEFQSNANYSGESSFFDLPAQVAIYSGSETLLSQKTYGYDGSSRQSSSISEQHGTPLFSVFGHATSETDLLNTGSSNAVHQTTYYDTGEPYQSIDPLGYTTTYNYSSTYEGSLLTSASNPKGQTITNTYVPATGQIASVEDPNSETTYYTYADPLNRLTEIKYPDNGSTMFVYQDTGTEGVTVTQAIAPSVNKVTQVNIDGVGRMYETEVLSDPAGPVYTRTSYDALGRTYQVWNPTRCNPMTATSCSSETTWGTATSSYDALNRTKSQIDADGVSTQLWTYSGNQTTYTDESGNQWQQTKDALGRLTSVLEPNGTNQSPSMQTSYTYDALGNLLTVAQCGGACGTGVNRSFTYDSLSRLVSGSNPESGLTSYRYDLDGDVLTKTSPAVNVSTGTQTISYCYDNLNRMTYRFPSASSSCTSPTGYTESYTYDTSSVTGWSNVVGRLTDEKAYIGGTLVSENTPYAYDPMGRLRNEQQCPVGPCATPYTLSYTYNYAGNVSSSTNGLSAASNALAFGFIFDADDHLQEAVATSQPSGWSSTTYPGILILANETSPAAYDPFGNLIAAGAGLASTTAAPAFSTARAFDARARLTSQQNGSLYSYTVPSGGYAANSNLKQHTDSVTGSWAFGYDTLNRLTSAIASSGIYSGTNGCWTYDAFGNRKLEAFSTVTSTPCAPGANDNSQLTSLTYSTSYNNQVQGYTYDAAGDVTYDGRNYYGYDPDGRLCAVGVNIAGMSYYQYLYDAEGRRVGKGSASSLGCAAPTGTNHFALTNQYLLGLHGEQVTELAGAGGAAPQHSTVMVSKGVLATYDFVNGGLHFGLSDPLGTKRVQVSGTGTAELNCVSLPFGNNIGNTRVADCLPVASSSAPDAVEVHFTGKERDTESGNDNFGARYFGSSTGRFISPDSQVGTLTNPQTLNRYAYVLNNPLIFIDPTGHDCVYGSELDIDGNPTVIPGDCRSDTDDGQFYDGHLTLIGGNAYSGGWDYAGSPYQPGANPYDPQGNMFYNLGTAINSEAGPWLSPQGIGTFYAASALGALALPESIGSGLTTLDLETGSVSSSTAGFGTTAFGNAMHAQFGDVLLEQTPTAAEDWQFAAPNAPGVDATYFGSQDLGGYSAAELKPYGYPMNSVGNQIGSFSSQPGTTSVWWYNSNGIIGNTGWTF
jgi:RHS repeat-associated protein